MTNQLTLITPDRSWRLDTRTRRRGLEGVAAARAMLLAARIRAREAEVGTGPPTEASGAPEPAAAPDPHVADAA